MVGFHGQEDFTVYHTRGSVDLRAINDLFLEKHREWFEPDEVVFESDMEWEDDDEEN